MKGFTPLHLACDRGNREAVQVLLRRGADCSVKVYRGYETSRNHIVQLDLTLSVGPGWIDCSRARRGDRSNRDCGAVRMMCIIICDRVELHSIHPLPGVPLEKLAGIIVRLQERPR